MRLVETVSGGVGGGRSRLSLAGRDFIRKYARLRAGLDELIDERFEHIFCE